MIIPSSLTGFHNTETNIQKSFSGRDVYCYEGHLTLSDNERKCSCGCRMHINRHRNIRIRHLSIGNNLTCVSFPHNQLRCPSCGATKSQYIHFKAPSHMITDALYSYTRDLLATGTYTNKQIAELTGLGENTVKAIDKKRLQERYTTDNGTKLKKPENKLNFLV